jgi:hypothetical protein
MFKNLFKRKRNDQIELVKFKVGEGVYVKLKDKKYIGQVISTNGRYVVNSIPGSWKVDCYVAYDPDRYGKYKKLGCFNQDILSLYDKSKDRDIKIDQILGK